MAGNNGNGPIAFLKDSVPILGKPFTMKSWFVTLMVLCECAAKEPVLLVGNGVGKCSSCGRMFQSQGLKGQANGDVQFMVGLVVEQKPAATV